MRVYKLISHTADIGFKSFGKTKQELFKNSAKAFFDIMIGLKNINALEEKKINVKGNDLEELLFNFLDELLYAFTVKKMVFKDFLIKFTKELKIVVKARGEKFSNSKHHVIKEIKAITYHNFKVSKIKGIWSANIILDI